VPGIYRVASLDTGRVILNTDLRAEVAQPVEVYAVVLLVDANHEVEYQGATYCQYPMQLQAMETTTENQDISVQLIMANVDKNIEYLIHEYDGLRGRRYVGGTCYFRYKDPETCGYSGTLPACNHTLADCIRHGNQLRFGGFPGVTMKKRIAL
jgi:phage-related protein